MLGGIGDVDRARLANGLAVVDRLGQREMLGVGLDDVGHRVKDAGALEFVGLAPRCERLMGGVYRGVDVFAARIGDARDTFSVCRAIGVDDGFVGCVDPTAADEEPVGIGNGILHGIAPS